MICLTKDSPELEGIDISQAINDMVKGMTIHELIKELDLAPAEFVRIDGNGLRGCWDLEKAELFAWSDSSQRWQRIKSLDYVGMAKRVKNGVMAAGRLVWAKVKGERVEVGPEEYARRVALCLTCEHYNDVKDTCSKCGCKGKKAKLKLATEGCPEGKWQAGG